MTQPTAHETTTLDALRAIHADMLNARGGGDEWASEWLTEFWTQFPLELRAAVGDQDAIDDLAAAPRPDLRCDPVLAGPRATKEQHMTDQPDYVVIFDPRPVEGIGALDCMRRMTLTDARSLVALAARIPKFGRIFCVATLEEMVPADDPAAPAS